MLSIVWGLIILGILILRVRNVLHVGLMEAALERSVRTAGVDGELEFCAQCEMPLLEHAAFCNVCGTAVRVQSKAHKAKAVVVAGRASSEESIVPGFDTPLAGEEGTVTAEQPTAVDESTAVSPDAPTEAEERNRFYDDEEGRA